MYNEVKTVIESGSYELVDILAKIDKLWLEAKLTDEQREELTEMARDNANPENSKGDLAERVTLLETSLDSVLKRLDELEGSDTGDETIEPWDQNRRYYVGDKCLWNGEVYEAILGDEGHPVVWSPEGYPAAWRLVE